jgi:hypothetical protein
MKSAALDIFLSAQLVAISDATEFARQASLPLDGRDDGVRPYTN